MSYHSIRFKLISSFGALFLLLLCISSLSWVTLERVQSRAQAISDHSVPQVNRMTEVQLLMVKISMEVRHAMLSINSQTELQATFGRIASHRARLSAVLDEAESHLRTEQGREIMRKIRGADSEFQRLSEDTIGLIKQEDVTGAFALLDAFLVPARNIQLEYIADQIALQRQLMSESLLKADESIAKTKTVLLVALLFSVIVIGGFVIYLVKSITSRLSKLQDVIVRVEETGDLTLQVQADGKDEVSLTASSFDRMVRRIGALIFETRESANAIAAAAQVMAQTGAQVESSSDAQSSAASTVAAAVEETSVSVSETASHAASADEMAKSARQDITATLSAARGTAQDIEGLVSIIDSASSDIARLADRSRQIDGIVKTIKEIADQTNLLALNAAIEAARAGEQGRGFAVVADEVRKLAENTAKSTSEISGLVSSIQTEVDAAVSRMESANLHAETTRDQVLAATVAIDAASNNTGLVSEAVKSISDAIREQDVAVQQVALQIEQIAQMTEANTASAQAAAVTSRKLEELAQGLRSSVDRFKV